MTSNATKYVRNGTRFLVFSNALQHLNVAREVLGPRALFHGAGFVDFSVEDGQIAANCHGKSESLGKEVRRDDWRAILVGLGIPEGSFNYVIDGQNIILFSQDIEFSKVVESRAFYHKPTDFSAGVASVVISEGVIKVLCETSAVEGFVHKPEDASAIARLLTQKD